MAFPPRPKAKARPKTSTKPRPRKPPIGGAPPSNPSDMMLPGGSSMEAPPPRLPGPRSVPSALSFSPNAPPLSAPSAPLGVGHMSNARNPKGMGTGSEASDAARDKRLGIKEGSRKDTAMDRKAGSTADKKMGAGAGNWISGAIKKPGALRADLGVPKGKPIPAKTLNAAASKGGKTGQRARLAQTLKGFSK